MSEVDIPEGRRNPSQSPEEIKKEMVTDQMKEENRLSNTVTNANTPIYKITSIFPIDIFRDELIVDLNKVTVITKLFLALPISKSAFTIELKEATLFRHFFTSDIQILTDSTVTPVLTVTRLRHSQAQKAINIISGLIIASKQGIDLTKLEPNTTVISKLEALGQSKLYKP